MAEVTTSRTGEFLRELFAILLTSENGLEAREAMRQLAEKFVLTDYEKGQYQTGGRRFDKIVRFATVDCVKAGWLLKDKGIWIVTDEGQRALGKYKDPGAFYAEARRLYNAWKAAQPDAEPQVAMGAGDEVAAEAGAKSASITLEEAEDQAWEEIEHVLAKMSGYEFQDLVKDLLTAMSYHVSWVAPPGKDGGVDLIAGTDVLGTRAPRIKVQVKNQGTAVNVEGLRAFLSILGDDDVGIFVCSAGFTKDAGNLARAQERRRISLIDQRRLVELWIEYYSKLSDRARRRLPLRAVYFLAPEG